MQIDRRVKDAAPYGVSDKSQFGKTDISARVLALAVNNVIKSQYIEKTSARIRPSNEKTEGEFQYDYHQ